MALKGLVIYFDGPDGVGKTTQLNMATLALQSAGHTVNVIHALGGSPIGDEVRKIMMGDYDRPAETDMYLALACQHAQVKSTLARRNEQQIILIDRSPLSIIAYQVFAGGLPADKGYAAAREILDLINPDLIMVYRASDNALQTRRQARNSVEGVDHFEKMPPTYHQEVAKGYTEAASRFGAIVIESDADAETVHQATMERIKPLLKA